MSNCELNNDRAGSTIEAALRAAELPAEVSRIRELSGGCIHRVAALELKDGRKLVAKINAADCKNLFDEELSGLIALAQTQTVVTPIPLACVADEAFAVLLMTAIEAPSQSRSDSTMWERFGQDLAALHAAEAGTQYGFQSDNHIGMTLQVNRWCDDWITFNQRHRLGHQLKLARNAGLIDASETAPIEAVVQRLDAMLPRCPKPALLHGDLWSGNALPAQRAGGGSTCAVIDPACSIGDGLADIAMMKLFGGFPLRCFDAYTEIHSAPENAEQRIRVYQLYHVLNHINLFGRRYAAQAMALVRQLDV